MIGCSILVITFAKESTGWSYDRETYSVWDVTRVETWEITTTRDNNWTTKLNKPIIRTWWTVSSWDKWVKENSTWWIESILRHTWFSDGDIRQTYVNYAYKLWGMDLVTTMECENWNWDIKAVWDGWHAFGLCQMNDYYHNIPTEYFNDWIVQVEYCAKKRAWWTLFYWPWRIVKWQRCADYVKNRFIFLK